MVSSRSSMEHVNIPGKSYYESQHHDYLSSLGFTDIRAFLESFADIEIQLIIRSTLDQGDDIYGLEDVRDNP